MAPEPNTSVDQIFDALHLLVRSGQPLGVADVARELDVPTSTAHRLLATVQEAGFVGRDSTGTKYELGSRAYALVHGLFGQFPISRAAAPTLGRLATQLGDTTVLDVRIGWLAVRMAGFEGWKEIHAATRIGQAVPLAETAGGLAILARLTDEELDGYVRWENGGRRSAARRRALEARLGTVRQLGYARQPALDDDRAGIAFALLRGDRAVAAICVDGTGPVVDDPPRAAELTRLRRAIEGLERSIERDPALAADPFEHVDPDALTAAAR